jgi:hypothetical protein
VAESLLYPRLPPAIARRLFEASQGAPLDRLRTRAQTSHPDAVFAALGGVEVNEEHLRKLAAGMREAADEAGFPASPRTQETRDRFDLGCARILDGEARMVAAEAAAVDVWAFLGAVLVPEICFWRFPDPPADRVIGPDLTRHTLARLWWRGYQLKDLQDDGGLAALTLIPENEMNQLFERRSVGGNRALVRATARVLLTPDESWHNVNRRALVRDSLARLQRLLAFMMLEGLDEPTLEAFVRSVFDDAAAALSSDMGAVAAVRAAREEFEAPEPVSAESESAGDDETEEPFAGDLDHALLSRIPAQIATLVNELGGVPDDELVDRYQRRFRIQVPSEERDLIRRFAWSAKGRRFIELDEEDSLWLPGAQSPAEVEQLDDWTINRIYERAAELLRAHPDNHDPFDQLVHEVYRSDGGRVPRLVMSLVGRILNRARRDINGRRSRPGG